MRVFGITRSGLAALAISVAALWGCIALESVERHRGERDALFVASETRRLRQPTMPVTEPERAARPRHLYL
jgi:hypothetical protein